MESGDDTSGFVGDSITVGLSNAPTISFSIDTLAEPGNPAANFLFTADDTFLTTGALISATNGDDVVLEGLGTLDGLVASWSFLIAGDAPRGDFTLAINTPPIVEASAAPLPASLVLRDGPLAAFGLFGYRSGRKRKSDA